jgi:hypothetical protein
MKKALHANSLRGGHEGKETDLQTVIYNEKSVTFDSIIHQISRFPAISDSEPPEKPLRHLA